MPDPTTYDRNELIARIGTFFLLIGIVLFLLFIASDADPHTPMPDFNLMCAALMLAVVGFIFRRAAPPTPKAERFRYLRKVRQEIAEARKKAREEAEKKKKAAKS